MGLFQKSVLTNYLASVSDNDIEKGWNSLISYKEMGSKVQTFKEEVFQAKFLEKIFVDCFGYKSQYDSAEEGNLFFEQKNTSNSKKADGAIKKDGEVIAVIELKSTKTKNLDDVKEQAFGYYTNNSKCEYVITSNFNKLRFYIERNEDYLEFDLFNIDKEEFKLLWLCLDSKNLLEGKPKEIKNKSLISEENITKKLYQDYSTFRQELFNDLVENNQTVEKRVILNKTQKLLDRLLFILFSEDRGLLPANSISEIINHWEFGGNSLYSTFLTYFEIINKGRPKRGDKKGIYAYNGGLFSEDIVLNTLNISDDVLLSNAKKLTKYDFESDVSVDILGHIFEHSLSEIEELQNQIDGVETDKSKSKRKKDGVYYTPKYITKYIVDNTLGKLCDEKKIELDINEETYSPSAKRSRNRISALDDYRSWLLQLTICDPACGSGAFLIQALNFLIKEHHYIDELSASYNKDSLLLSDVKNSILENNLYGVDINQESVEIAKLSLWLNTAESNRKLTSLNNNIKCGNSLIDDPEVAGDKAFNWQNEFPEVFSNGGFDIVIGNPPYVRSRELFSEKEKNYYLNNYITTSYQLDLYKLFIEKSCSLININGKLSFITPSVFLTNDYDKPLRKFIIDKHSLEIIVSSDKDIFNNASVKTVTFIISSFKEDNKVSFFNIDNSQFHFEKEIKQKAFVEQDYLINENLNISAIPIINKLNKFEKLGNYFIVKNGIKVRKDLLYKIKKDDEHKPFILGRNIFSYISTFDGLYIDYGSENEKLFTNQAFRTKDIFEQEKLITRQILGNRIMTCFDNKNYYTDQTTYVINKATDDQELKYLLCVLNSKLIYYFFINTFSDNKITFPKVKRSQLLELPYNSKTNQEYFVEKANYKNKIETTFFNLKVRFVNYLKTQFTIEIFPKKIHNWQDLEFGEFIKELNKSIKKSGGENLTKSDEMEWMDVFESNREEAQTLKYEINKTDKEIDQMVYELYGLTKEEIEIVENS